MVLPPLHPPNPVMQAASPGSWFPSSSDRDPTLFCSKAPGSSPVGEMLTCPFKWLAVCIPQSQLRSWASQCRWGRSLGDGKLSLSSVAPSTDKAPLWPP